MKRFVVVSGQWFRRWVGWKRLGIAASVTVIAIAVTTLLATLRSIDPALVVSALREISPPRVGLAALCVLGAFVTLTFYDLFALRTINKGHVPYRIAALSSFTSYSIGHNIGATVFTGGAIRFRIYSEWGLGAIDVATDRGRVRLLIGDTAEPGQFDDAAIDAFLARAETLASKYGPGFMVAPDVKDAIRRHAPQ